MRLGLIESAWWHSSVDPLRGMELAKEIGFDTYDLMPTSPLTSLQKRDIRTRAADVGLELSAITVIGFSLVDFNPSIRSYTVDWLKQQLDTGYDVGCRSMVLGTGEYWFEKQELDPGLQWRWMVEGVRDLGEYAETLGMTIALETLAHKYALLNSVGEMRRFLDDVNNSVVLANADLSHMFLNHDPPSSLERLKGSIDHVHISDCKNNVHGDLPAGKGDVPLEDYVESLRDVGFDGDVMVELEWCPTPEKARELVTEAYRSTAELMRRAGVRK